MGAASSCSHPHLLWLLGGAKKKPVDMVELTMKSLPVEKEASARLSLHCHLCYYVAEELKPSSKVDKRLRSHRDSPCSACPPHLTLGVGTPV